MTTPPSKQLDQFVVRLPDGMRERIKVAAETNNRSMNAEIVATLEEKYPAPSESFDGDKFLAWISRIVNAAPSDQESMLEKANRDLAGTGFSFMLSEKSRDDAGLLIVSEDGKLLEVHKPDWKANQ
ncbi:hypothetical protein CDV50_04890 [Haematobacter massiliensis]|uniref:Arc family DNA-binding protein n=1 Tax=Haematobacter massiliensis TaxID=195105 RepID=UPI000B4A3DB8|nr:Arc family DNA-binding protein [Haematobacter massiliensis]OWJ72512.1 hypothetical protein CDV50_04890 [Haematobacter massiliensis]